MLGRDNGTTASGVKENVYFAVKLIRYTKRRYLYSSRLVYTSTELELKEQLEWKEQVSNTPPPLFRSEAKTKGENDCAL